MGRQLLTNVLLLLTEHLDDSLTGLSVGELDVVLGATVVIHQGKEVVIGNVKLKPKSVIYYKPWFNLAQ